LVSRGWHGWLLVALVVVVFDVGAAMLGGEAMTDAARRWYHDSIGRWAVGAVVVFLALHLTVLPRRFDPLDRAYTRIRARYAKVHFDMPTPRFVREHDTQSG